MFTANRPTGQSFFGNTATTTGSPFGQSTTNTNQSQMQPQLMQQQQQQQPQGNMAFGQSQLNSQPLGSSLWQPGSQAPQQKSVPEQIELLFHKWHPASPNCEFKTYLYNKVEEAAVPLYKPGPGEDPKAWEEALQAKPAPNYMPVLCAGFPALHGRLMLQRRVVSEFNRKLHEINDCLDAILARHDLAHSVRALAARRRHAQLRRRVLALAARAQVARNRGFALSADEDELQLRLRAMEREMQDPALSARMEELWSRLIVLRGYADKLQEEMGRLGMTEGGGLGEEVEAKAKKILEDYEKQLQHLKKEVEQIRVDFDQWDKDHKPTPAPR